MKGGWRARDARERRELLEALAFALAKAEARSRFARVERGRVILPREKRLGLLSERRPAILTWGREPCPITPGMTYRLGHNLELRFTEIRRSAKGDYRCLYVVRDFRPLTLRTRPSDGDGRRESRLRWSATEEHGYSHSTDELDAGDVLDPIDQHEIAKQAEVRRGQQDVLNAARRERHELGVRLARIEERALSERIDISKDTRVIKKRIEALERRVLDKAA